MTITLPVQDWSKSRRLVVDSTGVKTDEATLEIISVVTSTNDVSDAEALPDLLQDVPGEIEQVSADGAYNQRRCYDTLNQRGVKAAIPPRKAAKIWRRANTKAERHVRDENLRRIQKAGRKQ